MRYFVGFAALPVVSLLLWLACSTPPAQAEPKRTPYSDCKAYCAPHAVAYWGRMPGSYYGVAEPVCICKGYEP